MDNLEIFKDGIANAIQSERYTLAQVVAYLTERHGHMKGFSERTLRRYCNENGIRASSKAYVADDVLAESVEEAIEQVRRECIINLAIRMTMFDCVYVVFNI